MMQPAPARILDALATIVAQILGAALIGAVILNVINVVARYGFDHAMTGVDEFQIYLMVGIAFLGGLVAHIRRRHLRMDVLTRYFPPTVRTLLAWAESLLSLAVCTLLATISWNYTVKIWRIGSHSANADIPMWIPHSILAIAFTLIALAELTRILTASPAPQPQSAAPAEVPPAEVATP